MHFDGLFLLKVCNVWAKEIRSSCVVKIDLWFQKWRKELGEQVVESKVGKSYVYNVLAEEM